AVSESCDGTADARHQSPRSEQGRRRALVLQGWLGADVSKRTFEQDGEEREEVFRFSRAASSLQIANRCWLDFTRCKNHSRSFLSLSLRRRSDFDKRAALP